MPSQKSVDFVEFVLQRIHKGKDRGFGAKLRKADNEATEYQSWEILAQWIDLEKEKDRKAYGLIGASLARTKIPSDGKASLGKALQLASLKNADVSDIKKSSAALRLRRLLACKDRLELIEILRPILRYLESKEIAVCHAQLLDDILWFEHDSSRERIRARWAQDFFGKGAEA